MTKARAKYLIAVKAKTAESLKRSLDKVKSEIAALKTIK